MAIDTKVWVFAYGSLIWNPGFEFDEVHIGYIKGYSRRFYQGSDQHRGSPESLGRVATLIEDNNGITWGLAYSIADNETALNYLKHRESSIGGYTVMTTKFHLKDPKIKNNETIDTLVYIALPCNRLFLGPSPSIAHDIANAKGFCGYNIEYLFKLIAFMKIELPNIVDEHLQQLEHEVLKILANNNPKLLTHFSDAIESWLNNVILMNNTYYDSEHDDDIDIDDNEVIKSINQNHNNHIHTHTHNHNHKNVPKQRQQPLRCMIRY